MRQTRFIAAQIMTGRAQSPPDQSQLRHEGGALRRWHCAGAPIPSAGSKAEAGVRFAQTYILGRLRHQTFFSLAEANLAIVLVLERIARTRISLSLLKLD